MGKMMNAVKRTLSGEMEAPAAREPIDLRTQYVEATAAFIAAKRRTDQNAPGAARHWASVLCAIRDRAREDGNGEKLDAVWVQPPTDGDVRLVDWYQHTLDLESPGRTDAAGLEEWLSEVEYRLEHGKASGNYRLPPPPPAFRRASDIAAAGHSPIVLLAPYDGCSVGARLALGAAVSHELVERGAATWCEPARVPLDPRPPIEQEPGEDWQVLHFLRGVRLASRHDVLPGSVRPVPPDEAAELVEGGVAEPWVPPPPPPPRVPTMFGPA